MTKPKPNSKTKPVPARVTLAEAAAAPLPPGRRSALLMKHGSMELRHYAPKGHDPQTPHDQDEIYIVASGRGFFVRGAERVPFGPLDALFVAAGVTHRFEDFSPDFAAWVVFYGKTGGEAAGD
jgi:mannose-6-phosphate isomerase-like protein (cupin superfamily)